MASIRLERIRFTAYSMDHDPRHVHGFYSEVEVIVDLREDGTVSLANRSDAIRPGNASRSAVRHILMTAAKYFDELVSLWEKVHG
jgi:hypothetical protein